VLAWLDERVPIAAVIEVLPHKRVPEHRFSIWYYFGGITLFLFVVQVVTGGLLLLYYRPSAGEAYESVRFIMTRVPFGWLVRSIHAWSANVMIAGSVPASPRGARWIPSFFIFATSVSD
jgi:cytochrome b6